MEWRAGEVGGARQGQAGISKPGPKRLREEQKLAQSHTAIQGWSYLSEQDSGLGSFA